MRMDILIINVEQIKAPVQFQIEVSGAPDMKLGTSG